MATIVLNPGKQLRLKTTNDVIEPRKTYDQGLPSRMATGKAKRIVRHGQLANVATTSWPNESRKPRAGQPASRPASQLLARQTDRSSADSFVCARVDHSSKSTKRSAWQAMSTTNSSRAGADAGAGTGSGTTWKAIFGLVTGNDLRRSWSQFERLSARCKLMSFNCSRHVTSLSLSLTHTLSLSLISDFLSLCWSVFPVCTTCHLERFKIVQ